MRFRPQSGFHFELLECQARDQRSSPDYQLPDPEQSMGYRVLQENLESILAGQNNPEGTCRTETAQERGTSANRTCSAGA